ncbi:MAG: sigma-70 family RNA polymerase sigma factor [Mariniblastus sp.]|nr:sigma-70 family RNA polymerase sigma factor [Mariniblastus sp.]
MNSHRRVELIACLSGRRLFAILVYKHNTLFPAIGSTLSTTDSSIQKKTRYELLDPDVRLMLQVRDGNAAAFEELVERHQKRLVMVLEHLVGDRTQAEDLAQDVFLRVFRARERYIPTAKFSTWLYTITHNVASNSLRKSSRRKEVNLLSSPSGSMPIRPLDTMAKDKSNLMPTRLADQKEMEGVICEAIQALGDRQRMAMLLSKYEGMSYNEISETMGLTTQAVKSLLSRARGNLKDILAPYLKSGRLPRSLDFEDENAPPP